MTLSGTLLWICAAIACCVFVVMIHSVATFRAASGAGRSAFRHSTIVEVLWAIIPILIIAVTAVPAVKTFVVAADSRIAAESCSDTILQRHKECFK